MYISDMNETQQTEEKVFVELLSQAHWDVQAVSDMLHAGISVHPEGYASLELEDTILVLNYYAEESSITLVISARASEKTVRLRFEYGNHLVELLDWLIKNQYILNVKSFAKLLKEVYMFCLRVFLIGDDGTYYLIQISDS